MLFCFGTLEVSRTHSVRSEWDEGENATGRRFHPRSHENKEPKDGAMLLRAATIFSEVSSEARKCRVAALRAPATVGKGRCPCGCSSFLVPSKSRARIACVPSDRAQRGSAAKRRSAPLPQQGRADALLAVAHLLVPAKEREPYCLCSTAPFCRFYCAASFTVVVFMVTGFLPEWSLFCVMIRVFSIVTAL